MQAAVWESLLPELAHLGRWACWQRRFVIALRPQAISGAALQECARRPCF